MRNVIPADLAWADERELEAIFAENPDTGYPNMDAVMTEIEVAVRATEAAILRGEDKPPTLIPPSPWKPPSKPGGN